MPTRCAPSRAPYLHPRSAKTVVCAISAFIFLLLATSPLRPQSAAPPDNGKPGSAAWCSDLKWIAALAVTNERFSSIAGRPQQGNFLDTNLPLPGWKQCALYGPRTYTCDSPHVETAAQAEREQAKLVREIKACLADDWAESESRSSAGYVVLHNASRPASITVSTDQIAVYDYVVRLTLFRRGN